MLAGPEKLHCWENYKTAAHRTVALELRQVLSKTTVLVGHFLGESDLFGVLANYLPKHTLRKTNQYVIC